MFFYKETAWWKYREVQKTAVGAGVGGRPDFSVFQSMGVGQGCFKADVGHMEGAHV